MQKWFTTIVTRNGGFCGETMLIHHKPPLAYQVPCMILSVRDLVPTTFVLNLVNGLPKTTHLTFFSSNSLWNDLFINSKIRIKFQPYFLFKICEIDSMSSSWNDFRVITLLYGSLHAFLKEIPVQFLALIHLY